MASPISNQGHIDFLKFYKYAKVLLKSMSDTSVDLLVNESFMEKYI